MYAPCCSSIAQTHQQSENELAKWIRNISIVMDDHRRSVLTNKSLTMSRDWPYHKLRVFVGSWNVGTGSALRYTRCGILCDSRTGNAPPPSSLEAWLPFEEDYDIIAIGAQECKYSPERASTCTEDWFGRFVQLCIGSVNYGSHKQGCTRTGP